MTEIDEKLNLDVQWQPYSLMVLNENNEPGKHQHLYEVSHMWGKILMRVQEEQGNEKVAALYTALGERVHVAGRSDFDEILSESLAEAEIDSEVTGKIETQVADDALRNNTERGIGLVGHDVGVPIISIGERAFFGPVVSPAPRGEDALKLWQAVSLAIETPGFSELKRGREGGLDFS